jgi:hypothetical protein
MVGAWLVAAVAWVGGEDLARWPSLAETEERIVQLESLPPRLNAQAQREYRGYRALYNLHWAARLGQDQLASRTLLWLHVGASNYLHGRIPSWHVP